jgi:hypothetical protein
MTANDAAPGLAGYRTIEWLGEGYIERRAYGELRAKLTAVEKERDEHRVAAIACEARAERAESTLQAERESRQAYNESAMNRAKKAEAERDLANSEFKIVRERMEAAERQRDKLVKLLEYAMESDWTGYGIYRWGRKVKTALALFAEAGKLREAASVLLGKCDEADATGDLPECIDGSVLDLVRASLNNQAERWPYSERRCMRFYCKIHPEIEIFIEPLEHVCRYDSRLNTYIYYPKQAGDMLVTPCPQCVKGKPSHEQGTAAIPTPPPRRPRGSSGGVPADIYLRKRLISWQMADHAALSSSKEGRRLD